MSSSETTLGDLANEVAYQKLQYFVGCAIIELRHLKFESLDMMGVREFDKKNFQRILNIFEIEGCANLEPEHRIAATIDQETLKNGLVYTNISQETLLNPTSRLPLRFNNSQQLICLYGQHRLRAGEAHGETEWLVDLYLDGISTDACRQMREESSNALKLKDGEIYRTLRQYQNLGNLTQEQKWWARFDSDGRKKDIKRLQHNKLLLQGFDQLIPYIGLWEPFKTSQIERILGLKCHEFVYNYLCSIHDKWSKIVHENPLAVDSISVRLVEGLIPEYSTNDSDRISRLMESGKIFPRVIEDKDRKVLLDRLISTKGRILTINTLVQDTIFLEGPAKALHRLCPPLFRGSLSKALLRQWRAVGTGRNFEIQTSEHTFRPLLESSSSDCFRICSMQLWLFSFRHFAKRYLKSRQHRMVSFWPSEGFSLQNMAILAERVGFCSDQISNLRQDTSEDKISQDFFRSFCREEFYQVEKRPLDAGARRLRQIWRALAKPEDKTGSDPEYTTDNSDAAADHRFNCSRPVQYQQERRHLFLDQIYSIDQPRKQYVTSLAITRDIIFSFFGKSPLYEAITNQGVHPPNESNGALLPRTEISGLPREDNLNTHDPSLADNQSMTGEQSSGLDTHMHETQDIPSDQVVDNDQDMGTEQALVDQAQNVDLDQRILAEGFEDEPQPMFCEGQISVHRSFKEMLMLWFASNNNSLVVLYLFETRTLYKFPLPGNFLLRSTLSTLARTHYFLRINEYGFNVADPGKEFEEAVKRQLLFVGKRDHLGPSDCDVSSDALRDYITRYDVKTGKRYGGEIETQPATKRQEKRTS